MKLSTIPADVNYRYKVTYWTVFWIGTFCQVCGIWYHPAEGPQLFQHPDVWLWLYWVVLGYLVSPMLILHIGRKWGDGIWAGTC